MSLLLDLSSKFLTYAQVIMRGVETWTHSRDLYRKCKTYDSENWKRSDYVETALEVTFIASNVMGTVAELRLQKAEDIYSQVSNFEKVYDKQAHCSNLLEIERLRKQSNYWNGVNCCSYFTLEANRARKLTINIILTEEGLRRIGILARLSRCRPGKVVAQLADVAIQFQRMGFSQRDIVDLLQYMREYLYRTPFPNILLDAVNPKGKLILPHNLIYADIPQEYEKNEVFKRYICAISLCPIRYPLVIWSSGVPQYFELKELLRWLDHSLTNPLSGEPIDPRKDVRLNVAALEEIQEEMERIGLPLDLERKY